MKFKGTFGDQFSGSLAGITASRNRGGGYLRQRTVPVNPNTTQQQAVRNFFSQLAAAWGGTLTQAQRDAWKVYAENTPRTNSNGDPIILTGMQTYQRCNVGRLQAGLSRIDDGPTTFGLTEISDISITSISEATQQLTLAYNNADAWANDDDGGLMVSISRPQSPTIEYFKGPYRFAGVEAGDGTTPPTSPLVVAVPFPIVAGQKVFVKVVGSDGEGRLSSFFRDGAVASA